MTIMTTTTRLVETRRLRRSAGALLLAVLLPLGGCERLLKVTDPDIVTPGSANNPEGAAALYTGAVSDFVQAHDGNGDSNTRDGLVAFSGLLADEFKVSDTFNERIETDARSIQESNSILTWQYRNLMRANVSARRARLSVAHFLPADSLKLSTLSAITAYTEVLAGEMFCSGVPFANIDANGETSVGAPLTTKAMFAGAIAHFDSALDFSRSAAITNLARIGKARALLDTGDVAGAAAAVALVPDDFVFLNQHNASAGDFHLYLGVYTQNPDIKRYSVADSAGSGTNQINWKGDPRVPLDSMSASGKTLIGFDNSKPYYKLHRYVLTQAATDSMYRDTPLPLASGLEAQLIRAEAALAADPTGATWLPMMNDIRQDPAKYGVQIAAMAPLAIPAGATIKDLRRMHFRERAMWLFATGHRLGDMRRMIRQYGFTANEVFPIGNTTRAGQTYGSDVNLPVPQEERNNPNFNGCLDRNP